jgi:hypothetical protein
LGRRGAYARRLLVARAARRRLARRAQGRQRGAGEAGGVDHHAARPGAAGR